MKNPTLLSVDADAKTVKGRKQGFLTGIMYFAPANISGRNVCPMASNGCREACLGWHAGRVNILKAGETENMIRKARLAKTNWYFEDRETFMVSLVKEIGALVRKAARENLTPVVRLNGSSDIPWERVAVDGFSSVMERFPMVQFYDYTKIEKRAVAWARGTMPANYHLTFSMAENNEASAYFVLGAGGNVAAVFFKVPETYVFGPGSSFDNVAVSYRVVDGDKTDLRFLDDVNVIVGLKAKGDAKHDTSGFVR